MDKNEKKLNLFDLTSIGVGTIVGAGVFSMMGYGIAYTGRGIVLALFLAMFLVVMQSIRYPILFNVFELDGGPYAIDSLTSPRAFAGFTAGNDVLFKLGSGSVTALAFTSYLEIVFPALAPHRILTACAVLTITYIIVLLGSNVAAMVQNVMCVCMYGALALFVVTGLMNMKPEAYAADPLLPNGPTGLLMAAALMSYTCNGFQYILNIGKGAKNPRKNLPAAFFLAALIAVVLYSFIGFSASHLDSYANIAGKNLGDLAQGFMSPGLHMFFVVGGALFALGTSLVGGTASAYQPLVASAKDGWIPAIIAKKSKQGIPYVLVFLYLSSLIPIIAGLDLNDIVTMSLVPMGIGIAVNTAASWNTPERFAKEWKASGVKVTPAMYRFLVVLSVIASLVLAFYCYLSNGYKIVTAVVTIAIFVYGFLRSKSKAVQIQSQQVYGEG